MTLLAFASDPHVDDLRQKVDPATGLNAAFVDGLAILRWIAVDAEQRGCEALVICGDMTEQRHPAPWRVAHIRDALAEYRRGPVHLLRGNHDGLKAGRSIVDVLASGHGDWHGWSRPGVATVGDTAIAFLPWIDRHWLRAQPGFEAVADADVFRVLGEQYLAIARGLYVEASALRDSTVLACHATLSGGRMSDAQQAFLGDLSLVVDTGALAAIGWDAVIAGHLHRHQLLQPSPLVAYVGSPHRVDWGEEHDGPKGYLVVDTASHELVDGGVDMTFVPTPARAFVTVDYAADQQDWDRLLDEQVPGAIVRAVNVPAGVSTEDVMDALAGAFDIVEVRHARVDAPEVAGGLSESLTAEEAMEAFFEGDPDREALIERGRAILAGVGS